MNSVIVPKNLLKKPDLFTNLVNTSCSTMSVKSTYPTLPIQLNIKLDMKKSSD